MPRKLTKRGKGFFGDLIKQVIPIVLPALVQVATKKMGGGRKKAHVVRKRVVHHRKARGVSTPGRGVYAPGRKASGLVRRSLV